MKEVITFFSEYFPFSSFLEVPVFPPTFIPLTLAFLPVPFFTISLSKMFIFFEVESFKFFSLNNFLFGLL